MVVLKKYVAARIGKDVRGKVKKQIPFCAMMVNLNLYSVVRKI